MLSKNFDLLLHSYPNERLTQETPGWRAKEMVYLANRNSAININYYASSGKCTVNA